VEGKEKKTPFQQLCDIVPKKKAYFVKWYCIDEEKREKFEEYSRKNMSGVTLETAMDYLYEEDVQKAIKFWMGLNHIQNMINIYNSMYKKALSGDVQSARFIMEFGKSDFFQNKVDELAKLLEGVDLDG
jgi:hypothetical protein